VDRDHLHLVGPALDRDSLKTPTMRRTLLHVEIQVDAKSTPDH